MKIFLSWVFFGIGDLASRMLWGEGKWHDVMFRIYQSSMTKSVEFQGNAENGPWELVRDLEGNVWEV